MKVDDLLLPEWRTNPYPFFAELRAAGAIHWGERLDAWVLTRYADVAAALREPRLSSQRGPLAFANVPKDMEAEVAPFKQSLKKWALFRDPPEHTAVRALLNKAFVPGLIDRMRPKIQELIKELLEASTKRRTMEVVCDLAHPLPAIVIAEMIGVPSQDRDKIKRWSDDLASLVAPSLMELQHLKDGLKSWQEMEQYIGEMLVARRGEKDGPSSRMDLLSSLLAAEEKGILLSDQEVRATVGMLLFGGHETTTNLITNGVLLLLRHPEALESLRHEPALMTTAVEEMLRYESPVQMLVRIAMQDLVLCDQEVRKGQRVLLLLASANRDPAQFPDADRFLINRRENRHLAFGLGIHFCLGAALARAEAQLAFKLLLEHWPSLRLADKPIVWRNNLAFRCPQRLHITA